MLSNIFIQSFFFLITDLYIGFSPCVLYRHSTLTKHSRNVKLHSLNVFKYFDTEIFVLAIYKYLHSINLVTKETVISKAPFDKIICI